MKKLFLFIIAGLILVSCYLFCETFVEAKKRSLTDPKYKPDIVSSVSLIPSEVILADSRKFYYVNGTTTKYEGKRLNFAPKGKTKDFSGRHMRQTFFEYFKSKWIKFV